MKKLIAHYRQYFDAGWGIEQIREQMQGDGHTSHQIEYVLKTLFPNYGNKKS